MKEQNPGTSPVSQNASNKNDVEPIFAKVIQTPLSLRALKQPGNTYDRIHSITSGVDTSIQKNKKPLRILLNHSSDEINEHIPPLLSLQYQKDIYQIDLSKLVRRNIGETEKNIEIIFKNAVEKNWILFFDEADALFGKRTSARDAHDKYANLEVKYLLQQIENYNGIVLIKCTTENCLQLCNKHHFESIA
ncbi:MAG: AAA family ATPase [Chitinophagaceae bacterium]